MTATKNVAPAVGGTWLYKQGELVLGPVPGEQLVSKLYEGEVDGQTPIARMGESLFQPIAQVPAFKLELAKAEAKRRVDAAAASERAARAKKRNLVISGVALATLTVAAGGAYLGIKGAVHTGGAEDDDFGISISMPTIGLARAGSGEELLDYPGAGGRKEPSRSGTPTPPPAKRPGAVAAKAPSAAPAKAGRLSSASDDPDGMQTAEFDRDEINGVVAQYKKTLVPCLQAEARKGLTGQIPIEFVIGNDGHVNKLWIDHPQGKSGSLPDCMLQALKKWPFRPYPGEQATVGLSFNIGGKG